MSCMWKTQQEHYTVLYNTESDKKTKMKLNVAVLSI